MGARLSPPPSASAKGNEERQRIEIMPDVRHAIILAAGAAMRLAPKSDGTPKGLLEIAHRPLLDRSVALLEAAGVAELVIVTGYRARAIETALGAARGSLAIRYVRNDAYAETGSMASLLAAAAAVPEALVLVLESDLLYHASFLDAARRAAADVLLAADLSGSGDEVHLGVDAGNRLRYLGKHPSESWRRRSIGELAGISRLTPALLSEFQRRALAHARAGSAARHYEDVLFEIAQDGWPIRVELLRGVPWIEIDTPRDLERARALVWPRLAADRRGFA